jgi:hypothetical protein
MGCCKSKKQEMMQGGKNFEVKVDITKIVKYLCMTFTIISMLVFLPKIFKTLFVIDDEQE